MGRYLFLLIIFILVSSAWGEEAADKVNDVACAFISLVELLIGALVSIVIIFAGVKYVLSGDDPDVRLSARTWVINAFVGLLVIILAVPMVNLYINGILKGVNCEIIPNPVNALKPIVFTASSTVIVQSPTVGRPIQAHINVPGTDLEVESIDPVVSLDNIGFNVKNIGPAGSDAACNFDISAYVETENVLENFQLCTTSLSGCISAEKSSDLTCVVSDSQGLKDLLADGKKHTLVVEANPGKKISESDYDNNKFNMPISQCTDADGNKKSPGDCAGDGLMCVCSGGKCYIQKNELCQKLTKKSETQDWCISGVKGCGSQLGGWIHGTDCNPGFRCENGECKYDTGCCVGKCGGSCGKAQTACLKGQACIPKPDKSDCYCQTDIDSCCDPGYCGETDCKDDVCLNEGCKCEKSGKPCSYLADKNDLSCIQKVCGIICPGKTTPCTKDQRCMQVGGSDWSCVGDNMCNNEAPGMIAGHACIGTDCPCDNNPGKLCCIDGQWATSASMYDELCTVLSIKSVTDVCTKCCIKGTKGCYFKIPADRASDGKENVSDSSNVLECTATKSADGLTMDYTVSVGEEGFESSLTLHEDISKTGTSAAYCLCSDGTPAGHCSEKTKKTRCTIVSGEYDLASDDGCEKS